MITDREILIDRTYGNEERTVLYSDGTKVRIGNTPRYESMDLKITDYCDMGCHYCHEMSTTRGKHAKLEDALSIFEREKYKDVLEIAIGGGNPFDWPHLGEFTKRLSERYVLNATVNQGHLIRYMRQGNTQPLLMFRGLGVSLTGPEFIEQMSNIHPHVVFHVIAGIQPYHFIEHLVERVDRVLILGFKNFGRGVKYFSSSVQKNIDELKWNLRSLLGREGKTVAFDNLGVEQLQPQRFLKEWGEIYMGDDGEFSCYIDAVNMKQHKSSFDRSRAVELAITPQGEK